MSAGHRKSGQVRLCARRPERLYTIGELADELEVTTRAIRFYEAKGLIAPARRGVARSYSRRDRARLRLILRGKNLGFSLEEIAQYLTLYDADPTQITQTQMLLARVELASRTCRRSAPTSTAPCASSRISARGASRT